MNQPFYKANRSRFSIRMSGEKEMENTERSLEKGAEIVHRNCYLKTPQ